MKPRTLLILLVLSLGIFAFIYFFERELPSTAEREEQSKQVLPIGADDVDALEIAWGGKTVRFERDKVAKESKGEKGGDDGMPAGAAPNATWKVVSPLAARADAGVVSNLVRRLAELRDERTFDEYDAKETGLAEPRVKATLRAKGKERTLAFGAALPIGGAILVGDGDKAYQVNNAADLVAELQKNPGDWRDKALFHGERAEAEKITLTGGAQKTVLARRGDGETFDLEEPIKDAADRDLVSGLLSDITGLQAATFLEPGAFFDTSGKILEVQLATAKEPFRIELGQALEGGQVAAKVEGQLVALDASRLDPAFSRTPAAWRSPAWSGLQVFQVDRALFKTAAHTTEVKRTEGEWKRGEDKLDYAVASDALYPVVEVKATEILTRAEAQARGFQLASPRLEIELDAESRKEKLAVYPAQGELAAATAEGRDAVLLLPNEKVLDLEAKVEKLRTAQPGAAPPPSTPELAEGEMNEEGGAHP